MNKKQTAAVYRIALSAIVVSVYFVVMLLTAEFSFGIYQIRIATALYALALPFPFLVLPLAIANCLSNVLGGMAWDIAGGFFAGLLTAGLCAVAGKAPIGRWKSLLVVPAIEFVPALSVPLWLAPALGVPYWTLAASLLVGQIIPAAVGAAIVFLLEKRAKVLNLKVFGIKVFDKSDKKQAVSDSAPANDGAPRGETASEFAKPKGTGNENFSKTDETSENDGGCEEISERNAAEKEKTGAEFARKDDRAAAEEALKAERNKSLNETEDEK